MIPKSISFGDLWYALALSAVFAGIFFLASLCFRLVITPLQRRREIVKRAHDDRLALMARSGIFRSDIGSQKDLFIKIIERIFGRKSLQNLLEILLQADIYSGLPRFIYAVLICAGLGFLAGWYFRNLMLQFALARGGSSLPFFYLNYRKNRKTRLIEEQMPDTMELLSRSLRAGHTLPSAVDLAAQEYRLPWVRNCDWPTKSSVWD